MHTAFDLKSTMFTVAVDGEPSTRDALLDWESRDRLGIVIDRRVGALGAGLLIQLAITAFYDVPRHNRRKKPFYPEINLFHIGGPWGDFSSFDFWPDHKEIFLEPDAPEILRQINIRGITHLAVPDRPRQPVEHRFKEPEAALDRLKHCFVYSPDGAVAGGDVRIASTNMRVLDNYEGVLEMETMLANFATATISIPLRLRASSDAENQFAMDRAVHRLATEYRKDDPDHVRARQRVDAVKAAGVIEESYRRVPTAEILEMLA